MQVCDARLLAAVSREPALAGANPVASAEGTSGEVLDFVDADGRSVTSEDRSAKGMQTRVKRRRGVEGQAAVEKAIKDGELSLEEAQAMTDAEARDIFSDMGE